LAARRSITETPNELTSDIDIASPVQIVRLLRAADAQMFAGYGGYPGLYDPETLAKMARLAAITARILHTRRGCIVLSGAGTSGRLAMFIARTFNEKLGADLATGPFRYTIAGGDAALIQAQEGAEDDPHQGIKDLEAATADADDTLYIGITCGLSAPYIAGQLEHMLAGKVKGHAVLLGFNPVDLARNTPIEGWPTSFHETARRIADVELDNGPATLLNPIIGPEPITGSTRMKSGSATKILLESIFEAASAVDDDGASELSDDLIGALAHVIRILLAEYETAVRDAYAPVHELAQLVEAGGETLRRKGHIYYLGATGPEQLSSGCGPGCDHDHEHEDMLGGHVHEHEHQEGQPTVLRTEAGILGLVDASECPPTYGANFEDVRGFLHGGWSALLPGTEVNMSEQGAHFQISLEDFRREKLPHLSSNDLVVALGNFEERDGLLAGSQAAGARTAAVTLSQVGPEPGNCDICIELKPNLTSINAEDEENANTATELLSGPIQLAYKLVLNALTTGAHVLAGKVYGNRMVDLRISNNKLFHRTVGIISDLMGVDADTATQALMKSTYETDALTAQQSAAPIRDHIEAAKAVDKVVPKALLMATGKFTYADATTALTRNPIVRTAIGEYVAV
jgi:N-acetylmuramic acid 6-phosphate (MurNAc-6-P) etherase